MTLCSIVEMFLVEIKTFYNYNYHIIYLAQPNAMLYLRLCLVFALCRALVARFENYFCDSMHCKRSRNRIFAHKFFSITPKSAQFLKWHRVGLKAIAKILTLNFPDAWYPYRQYILSCKCIKNISNEYYSCNECIWYTSIKNHIFRGPYFFIKSFHIVSLYKWERAEREHEGFLIILLLKVPKRLKLNKYVCWCENSQIFGDLRY